MQDSSNNYSSARQILPFTPKEVLYYNSNSLGQSGQELYAARFVVSGCSGHKGGLAATLQYNWIAS